MFNETDYKVLLGTDGESSISPPMADNAWQCGQLRDIKWQKVTITNSQTKKEFKILYRH